MGPKYLVNHATRGYQRIAMLLKVVRSGKLDPRKLVSHRFAMSDILQAYDTFANAAKEGALKIVLTNA